MSMLTVFDLFDTDGSDATVHRVRAGGTVAVKAFRRMAQEEELEGDGSQQRTRFTVDATPFGASPPIRGDRIEMAGAYFTVHAVEPLYGAPNTIGGYRLTTIGL